MSYNITNWRLKKLENFRVPYKSLFPEDKKDWHCVVENVDDGKISLSSCGNDDLIGTLENDWLHVFDIDICGEGSGHFMHHVLEPAFKESRGILRATCVWEGGDCINILYINGGIVSWTEIEI